MPTRCIGFIYCWQTLIIMTKGTKNRKCYNCKHSGKQFKIVGKTHLHCHHPKYKEEDFESGELSPWDTLMEFWYTCKDYEPKNA